MTAAIIGATGLIGGYLLEELLKDDDFDTVRVLIRRPLDFTHPKLEKKLVEFTNKESFRLALEDCDVIFCTIGTTQKKVKGDKAAYRKVDYDIAVDAARLGKLCGCGKFVLVSSIGANPGSNNFYLKLKGEIEEAIKATGIKSIHILRPSVLLGNRKEFRLSEKIAGWLLPVFSFLLPEKYRPLHAGKVAKGMVRTAKNKSEGCFVYTFREINKLLI